MVKDEKNSSSAAFKSVLIIGVGLIGCSIAAALKTLPNAPVVRGINRNPGAITEALRLGYLEEGAVVSTAVSEDDDAGIVAASEATAAATVTAAEANAVANDQSLEAWFSDSVTELIILAVPVSAAAEWLKRIEASGYQGAITDVASTKDVLTTLAQKILSNPGRYIPGHPMAGSEVNGIEGARSNLFNGAHWILCPDEDTDPQIFTRLHEFVTSLGARSISLPREEHDQTIAIVSHVPHIVASALVQLAGVHASANSEIFRLAAGGFKDTTRIAAGSPELWSGIALDNRQAVASGLNEINQIIAGFERSISSQNKQELKSLLQNAAELRSAIPAAWVPDSSRLVEVRIPMANHAGAIAQVTGFAGKVGCNIQSIDIDHINEETAILELILTDEGDVGQFSSMLLTNGFDVSFRPLAPQE